MTRSNSRVLSLRYSQILTKPHVCAAFLITARRYSGDNLL